MTMEQLINVMDLQLKLRALREEFITARPLLPEETRMITYEKPSYIGERTVLNQKVFKWVTVTERIKIRLRKFGIPAVEERVHELCEEMREIKQQIISLGDVPEGYDKLTQCTSEENYG